MTETTNTTAEAQTEAPKLAELNDFGKATLQFVTTMREQYVALHNRVKAATEDRDKLVQEIRETHEDENLVKLRKEYDKLQTKVNQVVDAMNQIAATLIGESGMSEEQVADAKGQLKELRTNFNSAITLAKASGNDLTGHIDTSLPTLRGTSTAAGSGEGTKKVRVDEVQVNGKKAEHPVTRKIDGKEVKTTASGFSDGARVLSGLLERKVTVAELHEAYLKSASTDVGKEITDFADCPAKVEFRVGDHTVTVLK